MATTGSDSNAGTQASPFKTIAKAASVAQPNTTIHVADGTYTVPAMTTTVSGTSTGRIYFWSENKWGAKLVPGNSTSDTSGWVIKGNYNVIDGFDIDGQSSLGWRRGLFAQGSHIVLSNNHVHHIANVSPCDNRGGAGITGDGYFGGGFDDVVNNVVHHVGPPNYTCHFYHGIYMSSPDFTVKNNLTYQNSGVGIHVNHDWARGYIINNTVFRNKVGILAEGADFINYTAAGPITIENNIVYDNNPNGSMIGNVGGIGVVGTLTGTNVIANNYVYNNRDEEIGMPGGGTKTGNILTGAPGFVNYQIDGSGDYRLASTSQLIDKGIQTYAPPTDKDGIARPQGAGVDIGAFEYKAP